MNPTDVFHLLEDPEPIDAANLIINSLQSDRLVTIQGYCRVDYNGRAKSNEPATGFFTTILKPDGTVLVHSNEKYKPMNWQPSGADISPELTEDGDLHIKANSDEYLGITYEELFSVTVLEAAPRSELDLIGTEEEMHQHILSDPEIISDTFEPIEHEKKFSFGRVDVFGEESGGEPVIIEVKRRPITRDHIYQLYTYLMEYEKEFNTEPIGILASPSCSDYMCSILEEYDIQFVELQPLS